MSCDIPCTPTKCSLLMAAQPFDVASGDPHRVGPWFAGKLDIAPKVRDLAAQGFPLVGGRVDHFDGRRVSAIVFRRRDHVINVFIRPHASGPMRDEELRRNGYNARAGATANTISGRCRISIVTSSTC